eukprot:Lithocolla_globosa_v1_NODE_3850_length_1565_cov_56.385430.p1 type:complete len:488 gc:universal NODE_3850_length_1565_cov_56.385430:1503-40(-)
MTQGGLSLVGATTTFVTLVVGAGILNLPYVLSQLGWIPGLGMMVMFGLISTKTAQLYGLVLKQPVDFERGDGDHQKIISVVEEKPNGDRNRARSDAGSVSTVQTTTSVEKSVNSAFASGAYSEASLQDVGGIDEEQSLIPREKRNYIILDVHDCAYQLLGEYGPALSHGAIHSMGLGTAAVYLVLISQSFKRVMDTYDIILLDEIVWIAIFSATMFVIHVPVENLQFLNYISSWSAFASLFIGVLILMETLILEKPENPPPTEIARFDANTFFTSLSSIAFTYNFHMVTPTVYRKMRNPDDYPASILFTGNTVACLYVVVATLCYWAYGDTVQSPVTNSMNTEWLITLMDMLLVTKLMISHLVCLTAPEHFLYQKLEADDYSSPWKARGIRAGTQLFVIAITLAVPDFLVLLDLVSAISAPCNVFILPCLLYIAHYRLQPGYTPGWGNDGGLPKYPVYLATLSVVGGISLSVISLLYAVKAVIDLYS